MVNKRGLGWFEANECWVLLFALVLVLFGVVLIIWGVSGILEG
jgi:hypothetical protein